jgi:hypothetical protein
MESGTNLLSFNPEIIPFQKKVIKHVREFDYSQGVLEILLSGSYGSAKSIVMAHIGITHCLFNPGARLLLGRKAMPDLKDTILQKVLEHIQPDLVEDVQWEHNKARSSIKFWNGSEIISRSWGDKNYKKLRSLELSGALIEELTENDSKEFEAFYKELLPRVGRLPKVKENFILCATNPDAPSHSAYEYFFLPPKGSNRFTYLSRTDENPFLPPTYIETIKRTLTKQEIRRYVYGEWIEISQESIYYAYDRDKNKIENYKVDTNYPIYISWDFNIGEEKPMSCCLSQYKNGCFYFFDEVIIFSSRTLDVLEELNARGLFDFDAEYTIHGDASGKRRDTRSKGSDYDVIRNYMANLQNNYGKVRFLMDVPLANPPVRERHSVANGQMCNSFNERFVFIDQEKCKTLDKGFRLTRLKKGGNYIEDDSLAEQHVTTAATYHIHRVISSKNRGFSRIRKAY